ncbi:MULTISPECIES: NHL repeat-containing protein [unclassified Desulfurobacterium]|uniref:NHL repeat-containing protein n=1 Tax=Desulfurobacterium sp. TC5-1 TaxID=1158318 RepID=UPI0003B694D8|nr:NHL repeat-containing protein [Desulfurobacterium sp. TC5-1]
MSYNKRLIAAFLVGLLYTFPAVSRAQEVVSTKVLGIINIDETGKALTYPGSIFYDRRSRQLYVVEPGKSKVIFYTPDFFPFMALGKGYGIKDPVDLFVDKKGKFYFISSNERKIYVLSPSLILKKIIPIKGFKGASKFIPTHVAVNPVTGEIYVTGAGKDFVACFNQNGNFTRFLYPEIKVKGERVGSIVSNVGVDSLGRVYLVALDFGQVYVFDKDGAFLFKFGTHGANFGQLSQPSAVAVDEDNRRIYVCDPMRHAVLAYDMSGKFLFEFGGRGWSPGWFNYPTDVAVDERGNVIVTDWLNQRIQILKPEKNKIVPVETTMPSNRAD